MSLLDSSSSSSNPGQSSGASLEEMFRAMSEKLEDTVSRINQSVDERLAEVHQRMDRELLSAQRRHTDGDKQNPPETEGSQRPVTDKDDRTWADRVAGRTPTQAKKTWADRMSDEELSEDEGPPQTKKARSEPVSEETQELIKRAFTTTLNNSTRKEIRVRAPDLESTFTRCPRVDSLFKTADSRFTGNAEA